MWNNCYKNKSMYKQYKRDTELCLEENLQIVDYIELNEYGKRKLKCKVNLRRMS